MMTQALTKHEYAQKVREAKKKNRDKVKLPPGWYAKYFSECQLEPTPRFPRDFLQDMDLNAAVAGPATEQITNMANQRSD